MLAGKALRIKSTLVDKWEYAFHVEEASSEIRVYVECVDTDEKTGLWEHIPYKIAEKNVLIFKVPLGYINVFIRSKT